jgi:hypothetical protein
MRLHRAALHVGLLFSLSGCEKEKKEAPTAAPVPSASTSAVIGDVATSTSGSVAQAKIGGGPYDGGTLAFDIAAVHTKVDRADAPPWWKGTGDWTFFDATTTDGATMTVGLKETRRLKGGSMNYILFDAVIATKDNAEGEKLVKSLAKALAVDAPAPSAKKKIVPLAASSVVLAEDAVRGSDGSFSGTGGGWMASKWTFEVPNGDMSAEIFFNYNLTSKKGEFSRKSQRYDPNVVKFFAASLEDGAPLGPADAGVRAKP